MASKILNYNPSFNNSFRVNRIRRFRLYRLVRGPLSNLRKRPSRNRSRPGTPFSRTTCNTPSRSSGKKNYKSNTEPHPSDSRRPLSKNISD